MWAKSHVLSMGGVLRIRTYRDPAFGNRWVSGGLSMARILNQTYGRWVVRFRMRRGTGHSAVGIIEVDADENGAALVEYSVLLGIMLIAVIVLIGHAGPLTGSIAHQGKDDDLLYRHGPSRPRLFDARAGSIPSFQRARFILNT